MITFFTFLLFKQRKMTKQNKLLLKFIRKPLNYLLEGKTANPVNFTQPSGN